MTIEAVKRPCPDCGKVVTWTKANRPYSHKCIEQPEQQEPPVEQPPAQPGQVTPEMVIEAFIKTRDELSQLKKLFDAKVNQLKDLQQKRSQFLKKKLEELGGESFKTSVGTVFIDWKDAAQVADRVAFFDWIAEDWESRKHFLESRVSKAAVKQRHEDGEISPPGITYTRFKDVKIRRA